ncbi:hypothetical protein PFICI_11029 [Pestalotiopsis fici W106-1]|uniref:ASX DEUBAD domain-containing protein n=1 Tax=Pestalotiopsis fici (strain W106-1 / CGMCC3.15140) TaxID=1229662 RepID=W3WTI4_PESFW|nr:uncharacterized protein PFICI_11029 [Pestalotiopsis fici W106-1]ETS77155.1 hypothetical protein PFICI_11029 [Pestalotiopsis fici W106-1]
MELLVDENSALAKTNLRAMILDPEVWKLLTPEQVAHVQKYWPGDSYNGDLSALASNDHLRHDIAQYQKALADGQHDAEWIRQAKAANTLRNQLCDEEAQQAQQQAKAEIGNSNREQENQDKVDEMTEDADGKQPNDNSNGDHQMMDA